MDTSLMKIINPYDIQDITPTISGFLNLFSTSMNGSYEIRESICATSFSKILIHGNFTNIPITIAPGYCVQAYNPNPYDITFSYSWSYGGTVNYVLLVVSIIYFLCLVAVSMCCLCSFAGAGMFIKQMLLSIYYKYFDKDRIIIDERIPPQCEEDQIQPLEKDNVTIEIEDSKKPDTIDVAPPPKEPPAKPTLQMYPMNYIDVVIPSAPTMSKPLPPPPVKQPQAWSFPKKQ